jgi:phytoene dehydrogenase-like protein
MGEVIPKEKGEWVFVEGGMGSITKVLKEIAEEKGVA